jgi:hypothetical protein
MSMYENFYSSLFMTVPYTAWTNTLLLHRPAPKRSRRNVTGIERKMKVKQKIKSIRSLNYLIACIASQEATMEAYNCMSVTFTRWETEYTFSVVFAKQSKNITDNADNR